MESREEGGHSDLSHVMQMKVKYQFVNLVLFTYTLF